MEDNLFQFTTQANGTVAAREVAGNTADTDGLANVTTAVSKDTLYYNLITNNSTVFLIKNANGTYTTTTGINNIGSYVQGEVDYVDVNRDGVADYVYITAAPTDAITDNLFYYAGGQGSYNTATGVYTIPGYVDGVAGQIQTTNATFYNTIITGGTHKLYAVTITNGNVSAVSGFSTGNVSYTPGNSNVYTAYNGHLVVSVISGAAGDGYNNGVYTDAGYSNFVANANTKVYGQWATDMSDKDVIVVWNNNSGTAEHTLMLQAYIVDKSSAVPDPSPVTTGNIVRVVEIYQGGQLIGSRTATQTGVTAQTYTTGQDYASVSRVLPSLQVSGATVVEDVTSVTVVAGQTVTVTYKVAL